MVKMQTCSICGVAKPHTSEHFSGEGRGGGYLGIRCRPCKSKRVLGSQRRNPQMVARNQARRQQATSDSNHKRLRELTDLALLRQDNRCYYCGASLSRRSAHGDHKTPASRGGRVVASNIVAACKRCNLEKHGKTAAEYKKWLRMSGRLENR